MLSAKVAGATKQYTFCIRHKTTKKQFLIPWGSVRRSHVQPSTSTGNLDDHDLEDHMHSLLPILVQEQEVNLKDKVVEFLNDLGQQNPGS